MKRVSKKRALSLLLCLAMCFSLFSTTTFATEMGLIDRTTALETGNDPDGQMHSEDQNAEAPSSSQAQLTEEDRTAGQTVLPQAEGNMVETQQKPNAALRHVAQIGAVPYKTLDEAVAAASDGAVIELLGDCTTEAGLNLHKNLTIQAAAGLENKPTVTFTKYGIALWGKSVTFKDCDVVMNGIGSTPYYQEWNWMSVCGQAGSGLNLINVDMTMDGQNMGKKHAIYADNGMRIYMERSNLVIRDYGDDALEWNGGVFEYNVEMIDSTYLADGNRSGFAGTFNVRATRSKVDVIDSGGNGSNGANFYFTDSAVNFSRNGAHGLSANHLEAVNTSITANDNGRWGIVANRIKFENCKGDTRIQANSNGYEGLRTALSETFASNPSTFDAVNTHMEFLDNGYWKDNDIWPGVTLKNTIAKMDAASSLAIKGSPNTGLRVQGSKSVVEIAEGADVTITQNNAGYINGGGRGLGGGVRLETGSKLTLPSNAKIYNNHAELAGDDIYCAEGATITFGKVGSDWKLDNSENKYRTEAVRCGDKIDGWYYDTEDAHWNAHKRPVCVAKYSDAEFEQGLSTAAGPLALKAAHGLIPVDPTKPANKWSHSKSKTATNLDKNHQSKVTLSLPSAEQSLVSDVVFVFDESSCSDPVKAEVRKMMEELYAQVKKTGATVNIGAVQFRGKVTEFSLKPLTEETAEELTKFMGKRPWVGGSNMSMGLLAGENMLDASDTNDERKHLILVSDGIAYIWDDEATPEQENLGVNFSNVDVPERPFLASPDGWDVKYGAKYVPEDWNTHFDADMIQKTIQEKSSVYKRYTDISNNPYVNPNEQENYASTVDIALYKSLQAYRRIASKYHVSVVMSGVQSEMEIYPYGPSFMNYLADGKTVSFDQIQKDVFYLLDAGSKVVDTIGFGKDDKGNDYNMDFIPDVSKLKLTVGDETLDVTEIGIVDPGFDGSAFETRRFGFGSHENANYDFVLHYYEKGIDGKSDECFVWEINVPVSNFAPVQLTYTVALTDPQTVVGTYGQYDADGSEKLAALYTNQQALLYPVDSDGGQGVPELFARPTVSYTVSPTPDPEKPVDPGKPVVPDNPVNPDDIPQTGEAGNVVLWTLVCLVSFGGVTLLLLDKRRQGCAR